MKTIKTMMMAGLLLAAGLVLGGCATSGRTADASDHAVMCPKCETIWVRDWSATGGPRSVNTFSYKREMTCPHCDKMAKAYIEDNKLVLHECPDCKVTPKAYVPGKPIGPQHMHK